MEHKKIEKLHKMLKRAQSVFVMGHKDLDLDAIASCLAICDVAKNKKTYIILDDEIHETGVNKVLELVKKSMFIKSENVKQKIGSKSLLVIVDVNKKELLQNSEILKYFKDVIVIDHHSKSENTIKSTLEIIDTKSSSASELIVEYIHYYDIKINSLTSTILLAGISLDTNNFYYKTTGKTHYAAYYLTELGADIKEANNLLKQDIEEYLLRQKVIDDIEVIKNKIAFTKASNRLIYKKEEIAKIADTLLAFENIEVSFAIAKLSENTVGISARSIGNINIGYILSKLGGGGDNYNAAARIENVTIKEVEEMLKKVIEEVFR